MKSPRPFSREEPTLLDQRIDAAFAAGDTERAAGLVEEAGRLLFAGTLSLPLDQLEGWLGRLRAQVQDRPWLLHYQAWVWTSQRRHSLATVALSRAERLFRLGPADDERRRGLALVKFAQGVIAERNSNLVAAREAFAAARELLGESRDAETWINPADAARWRACDPAGAAAFYLEAIPAFTAAGEPVPLARCLHNLAMELLRRGEPAVARQASRRAVELKRSLDVNASLANSLNTLGMAERWLGLHDLARASLDEAREHAERGGHALARAYATNNLAEVERDAGDHVRAEALYEEAIKAKEALGDEYGVAYSLRSRSALRRRQGDVAGALAMIERALRLREPVSDPLEAAELGLELGLVRLAGGVLGEARLALGEARVVAEALDAKAVATLAALALAALDDDPAGTRAALLVAERHRFSRALQPELEFLARCAPGQTGDLTAAAFRAAIGNHGVGSPARGTARAWVLGDFRLEIGGRPVDLGGWRSKRAGELVRALVAARRHAVHREELVAWLWPESDEDHRESLNAAVNAARRGLEQVGGAGRWIVRNGDRYHFEDLAWVDADTLAERFEAARTARVSGDLTAARAALEEARALDGGEPHATDRYAEWAAAERARLTELAQLVREGYAALSLELGYADDALLAAVEGVAAEPSRESGHRLLIQAHLARGDRAAAVRALAACRVALAEELGVTPSAETEALLRS